MDENDLKNFINFMTHYKGLTKGQIAQRDKLLLRDIYGGQRKKGLGKNKELSPIKTADFLLMFREPTKLKFLTHNFAPGNDNRPSTIKELLEVVKKELIVNNQVIPDSLLALLNGFIKDRGWIDTYKGAHNTCVEEWISWSEENNNMHPLRNPDFEEEIKTFSSTIRTRRALYDIFIQAKEGLKINLHMDEQELNSIDFYTNTYMLYTALQNVFTMMNGDEEHYSEVCISTFNSISSERRPLKNIVITQVGSFSDHTINDVMKTLKEYPQAGELGAIKECLYGYCLWEVRNIWHGEPYRWNILRTSDEIESEKIQKDEVKGFTHIFKFY